MTWNSWITTKNRFMKLGPVHMAQSCPVVDRSGKMAQTMDRSTIGHAPV